MTKSDNPVTVAARAASDNKNTAMAMMMTGVGEWRGLFEFLSTDIGFVPSDKWAVHVAARAASDNINPAPAFYAWVFGRFAVWDVFDMRFTSAQTAGAEVRGALEHYETVFTHMGANLFSRKIRFDSC